METEPEELNGASKDISEIKRAELKQLYPMVFTETKNDQGELVESIDFEKLRAELGTFSDIFETRRERYGMDWPGKKEALRLIQTPSIATLKPCREESVNFDNTENLFVEGDNLEVLKLLQKSYYGRIKMIYIDPPYNTGKEFIYPDNYTESLETYLEYAGLIDGDGKKFSTNTANEGRFHTKWLNMMYPRLYLARNLLRDDGVIFISIDDNEVSNLRKICDEIFGEENFRGEIVRATGTTTGQDGLRIGSSYDYCLCYSKSITTQLKGLPLVGKDLDRFNNDDNDGKGKYALLQLRKTGYADRKEDRENMYFPILAPDGTKVVPIGPTDYLSRWRVDRKGYEKFLTAGLIVWKKITDSILEEDEENDEYDQIIDLDDIGGIDQAKDVVIKTDEIDIEKLKSEWKPYVKYYLSGRLKQVSNLWNDIDGNKKGSIELRELFEKKKVFDNPKPTGFIIRLIQISCNEKDIILDFFAGSCTTSHAALICNNQKELNVSFILIQLPEPTFIEVNGHIMPKKGSEVTFKAGYKTIAEIGKERTRRVIKKLNEEQEGKLDLVKQTTQDRGFKVFKLDKSNFRQWQRLEPITLPEEITKQLELHINHIDNEATPEDLLYEILIKAGFIPTEKIETKTISGKNVFSIANGELLICLENEITKELINAVVDSEPLQFICLDSAFHGNDQLKANAVQSFKARNMQKEKHEQIIFKTI